MTKPIDDETALEEVLALLARPPLPGTAEDERFGALLRQVLAASVADDASGGDEGEDAGEPVLPIDNGLRQRLEALAKQRSTASPFGENPQGIGPTLGMDVRGS